MIKTIQLVSFNDNERQAVEHMLDNIAGPGSPWYRDASAIARAAGSDEWHLEHVPLSAQGNVIAGAQLAKFFKERKPQDFVVFYGCAGALREDDVGSAFLIQRANYLSLGTVDLVNGIETVTLKNKWLCHVRPKAEVEPLDIVEFPLCISGCAPIDLCKLSDIPTARSAATDKVIRIRPTVPPTPVVGGPPHDLYNREEWSYGTALGLLDKLGEPVLVEMESYGIGRIAQSLEIDDRVVILRVTTDALGDQASSDVPQRELLERSWPLLASVIRVLFDPTAV